MTAFQVAHLLEQGENIIIVVVNSSFGLKPEEEQHQVISSLQVCAESAGLAGTVVPVWESGGRIAFIAPTPWHPFFRSISMDFVRRNINRTLSCQ